ncbi:uncharacterized protein LOC135817982 isoform X2 [Sycon ciliatum]|uniref:uncharacterized protein LOC135817982 isoform X2 n=1 Tax=Sycon ciliatum TaxID=27933 RepID=UPI0031F6B3A3
MGRPKCAEGQQSRDEENEEEELTVSQPCMSESTAADPASSPLRRSPRKYPEANGSSPEKRPYGHSPSAAVVSSAHGSLCTVPVQETMAPSTPSGVRQRTTSAGSASAFASAPCMSRALPQQDTTSSMLAGATPSTPAIPRTPRSTSATPKTPTSGKSEKRDMQCLQRCPKCVEKGKEGGWLRIAYWKKQNHHIVVCTQKHAKQDDCDTILHYNACEKIEAARAWCKEPGCDARKVKFTFPARKIPSSCKQGLIACAFCDEEVTFGNDKVLASLFPDKERDPTREAMRNYSTAAVGELIGDCPECPVGKLKIHRISKSHVWTFSCDTYGTPEGPCWVWYFKNTVKEITLSKKNCEECGKKLFNLQMDPPFKGFSRTKNYCFCNLDIQRQLNKNRPKSSESQQATE